MLQPLGDRVLVRVAKTEEQTVGGLVLAGGSKEETKLTEVIAVGKGGRTLNGDWIAPSVSVGQTVLLEKLAGIAVKHDGEEFLLVREAEILAVVATS